MAQSGGGRMQHGAEPIPAQLPSSRRACPIHLLPWRVTVRSCPFPFWTEPCKDKLQTRGTHIRFFDVGFHSCWEYIIGSYRKKVFKRN